MKRSPIAGARIGGAALIVAIVLSMAALAAPQLMIGSAQAAEDSVPGSTLSEVLAIARRLSPELAARALDTEAAQARVDIAGALPDPTVSVTSDEIDRVSGPRQNKMVYGVAQEIPLWGKRDLKAAEASAEADRARADARETENELIEKVKVAFARYYQTSQAILSTKDLHRAVHGMVELARQRYAQGRGSQQEAFAAQVENIRLATELVRLDSDQRSAAGRLNALLARPIDAPLALPTTLRPLPPESRFGSVALTEEAHARNPSLTAREAQIASADAAEKLAKRSWYPDATLNAAYYDRTGNGPPGYMAGVSFHLPLQWGLHNAEEQEASSNRGAAVARRRALELEIAGELAEATAALDGSRRTGNLLRFQLLPQSQTLLQSATASYSQGKTSLTDVLRAEHDLADLRIQLLEVEFDQQRQLAAIERLIGGDL